MPTHLSTVTERLPFGTYVAPSRTKTRHQTWRPAAALVGRVFLAAIFFVSGAAKLVDHDGTVAHMVAAGVPAASTLVWLAAFAELAGAAALATGFLTRLGAAGLILFLVPTSYFFHAFWAVPQDQVVPQLANFLKNLAIAGGLALLIAHGPGRWSLDHKLHARLFHRR